MAAKAGLVIGCSWHPELRAIHRPWLSNYGHTGIVSSKSPWDQLLWSHGQGLKGTEPLAPPSPPGDTQGDFAVCWQLLRAELKAPESRAPKLLSRSLHTQQCAVNSSQSMAEHRWYYTFTTCLLLLQSPTAAREFTK